MPQELTTVEPRTPAIKGGIPLALKRTAALVGYFHNHLEAIPGNLRRYALSAAHAPTAEQRDALVSRRAEIDAGLRGASDLTIREQVGILRSSMATTQLSPEAAQLAKQGFIQVLQRFPDWAVVEAAMRHLDGRAGAGRFAPTAAELAEVCRALIADHLTERSRINAILDAEVYHPASDEDRAEVARRYAEFVAETAKRATVGRGQPSADAVEPPPEGGRSAPGVSPRQAPGSEKASSAAPKGRAAAKKKAEAA